MFYGNGQVPGGVLEVYMTGGSDVLFWVENLHARYFLEWQEICHVFFYVLRNTRIVLGFISERTFRFGFSLFVNVEQKGG